jgi:sodium-dependent dicarboxylate transporter 2/3/5
VRSGASGTRGLVCASPGTTATDARGALPLATDDSAGHGTRQLIITLIAFAMPALSALPIFDVGGLSAGGERTLAVVAAGLLLWTSEALPIAVTSLAVVAMLAVVTPGESNLALKQALAGFQTSAPYFLLGSLALGAATVKTGLAQRLARALVRGARGSGNRLYGQMIVMMPPMAVLVPSALTRAAMLIPAYEEIFKAHDIERGHRLPRLIMLATALLQVQASTAVLTGGSVPVVASSLLGGISWARWFALMAVPNYATLFIFATVLFVLYRPGPLPPPRQRAAELPAEPPMSAAQWRALAIIGGTTTLWLTDSLHHLDPTLPALIGATALFLPVVGVLHWSDFEDASPWTIFLVTGSSLSLAAALQSSGAASWLADRAVGALPLDQLALVPLLLTLILLVAIVNVLLPNRTAVLGITIPLLMSLAPPLGLNPMAVGLIVPLVAQTTVFYPVQVATALVTFRTRYYAAGELFRAGLLLTLVSVIVILTIALPWWALLGEPIRK